MKATGEEEDTVAADSSVEVQWVRQTGEKTSRERERLIKTKRVGLTCQSQLSSTISLKAGASWQSESNKDEWSRGSGLMATKTP